MSDKERGNLIESSFEQGKGHQACVREVLVAETCTAKCPTCQNACEYSSGHQGLHHCPSGHEWI